MSTAETSEGTIDTDYSRASHSLSETSSDGGFSSTSSHLDFTAALYDDQRTEGGSFDKLMASSVATAPRQRVKHVGPEEAFRQHKEKQRKAFLRRQELQEQKASKANAVTLKIMKINVRKEAMLNELKDLLNAKMKRAEVNRNEHIEKIRKRAKEEEAKMKEIAFINQLQAENERFHLISVNQNCEVKHEVRLAELAEERARKAEMREAKEVRAEQRRQDLENERQSKVEKILEKLKYDEERIGEEQNQTRMQRERAAQVIRDARHQKLCTVRAAEQEMKSELSMKIRQKQQEAAERHTLQLEIVKRKANASISELSGASSEESRSQTVIKWCKVCNTAFVDHVEEEERDVSMDVKNESSVPNHVLCVKKFCDTFKISESIKIDEDSNDAFESVKCALVLDASDMCFDDSGNMLEPDCPELSQPSENSSPPLTNDKTPGSDDVVSLKPSTIKHNSRLVRMLKNLESKSSSEGNRVDLEELILAIERLLMTGGCSIVNSSSHRDIRSSKIENVKNCINTFLDMKGLGVISRIMVHEEDVNRRLTISCINIINNILHHSFIFSNVDREFENHPNLLNFLSNSRYFECGLNLLCCQWSSEGENNPSNINLLVNSLYLYMKNISNFESRINDDLNFVKCLTLPRQLPYVCFKLLDKYSISHWMNHGVELKGGQKSVKLYWDSRNDDMRIRLSFLLQLFKFCSCTLSKKGSGNDSPSDRQNTYFHQILVTHISPVLVRPTVTCLYDFMLIQTVKSFLVTSTSNNRHAKTAQKLNNSALSDAHLKSDFLHILLFIAQLSPSNFVREVNDPITRGQFISVCSHVMNESNFHLTTTSAKRYAELSSRPSPSLLKLHHTSLQYVIQLLGYFFASAPSYNTLQCLFQHIPLHCTSYYMCLNKQLTCLPTQYHCVESLRRNVTFPTLFAIYKSYTKKIGSIEDDIKIKLEKLMFCDVMNFNQIVEYVEKYRMEDPLPLVNYIFGLE